MTRRISSSRPMTGSSLPATGIVGQVPAVILERLVGLLGVSAGHPMAAAHFVARADSRSSMRHPYTSSDRARSRCSTDKYSSPRVWRSSDRPRLRILLASRPELWVPAPVAAGQLGQHVLRSRLLHGQGGATPTRSSTGRVTVPSWPEQGRRADGRARPRGYCAPWPPPAAARNASWVFAVHRLGSGAAIRYLLFCPR